MGARLVGLVLVLALVAACGDNEASKPPTESPTATEAAPTEAPIEQPSESPIDEATPEPEPTAEPATLTAKWTSPKNGTDLESAALTLSARVTAAGTDWAIDKVAFTITPTGKKLRQACVAKKANADDVWSCKVNLWTDEVPTGDLELSFNIIGDDGTIVPEPAGTRTITFAAMPPKPGDVSYKLVKQTDVDDVTIEWTYRVKWSEPKTAATRFEVYRTTACAATKVGEPCVTSGMKIPAKKLFLIEKVAGDARSYEYTFRTGTDFTWADVTKGILVQAVNKYGPSGLALAWSAECGDAYPCTGTGDGGLAPAPHPAAAEAMPAIVDRIR